MDLDLKKRLVNEEIVEDSFKDLLLSNTYIEWLSNFMNKHEKIDDCYFLRSTNLNKEDRKMIEYLEKLFVELQVYFIRNNDVDKSIDAFCLIHNRRYYLLRSSRVGCSCGVYDKPLYMREDGLYLSTNQYYNYILYPYTIEYTDLMRQYDVEEKLLANSKTVSKLDDILDKILENTHEFYEKVCACLTDDERMFIVENLKGRDCSNCLNNECNVINYDDNCFMWMNPELIGKSKVLKITDIHKL